MKVSERNLKQSNFRPDIRRTIFPVRAVEQWNRLPRETDVSVLGSCQNLPVLSPK